MIITDEAVASLDMSIRSEILKLLKKINSETKVTMIMISHDLSILKNMCKRIAIMYLGEIVENTTRIIVKLYTECEKDFKKGIDRFQALIAFKEIELAPLQQEAASEAAYVSMVNV